MVAISSILFNIRRFKPSSQQWLRRQMADPFVRKSIADNFRCRSAYKLIEIDDKWKILRPGLTAIDLGACPGSWSQVASRRVNSDKADQGKPIGVVIAVDLSYFAPIPGVISLTGCDFTADSTKKKIEEILRKENRHADVIISDMAPNASGIGDLDRTVIRRMCCDALSFAQSLSSNAFVCKFWHEPSTCSELEALAKTTFKKISFFKPTASRTDSSEAFMVAIGKI